MNEPGGRSTYATLCPACRTCLPARARACPCCWPAPGATPFWLHPWRMHAHHRTRTVMVRGGTTQGTEQAPSPARWHTYTRKGNRGRLRRPPTPATDRLRTDSAAREVAAAISCMCGVHVSGVCRLMPAGGWEVYVLLATDVPHGDAGIQPGNGVSMHKDCRPRLREHGTWGTTTSRH